MHTMHTRHPAFETDQWKLKIHPRYERIDGSHDGRYDIAVPVSEANTKIPSRI
ncbi:hypothetical protein BDW69DRAFT_171078 [Aspergillus filifer]